jgi:hypothetical protein
MQGNLYVLPSDAMFAACITAHACFISAACTKLVAASTFETFMEGLQVVVNPPLHLLQGCHRVWYIQPCVPLQHAGRWRIQDQVDKEHLGPRCAGVLSFRFSFFGVGCYSDLFSRMLLAGSCF